MIAGLWHGMTTMTAIGAYAGGSIVDSLRDVTTAASLVDEGVLRSTITKTIADFSATGLREAHRDVETGRMTGKVVVTR